MNQEFPPEVPPVPPPPAAPEPFPQPAAPEPPKRSNTWLIVGIVVVVLCCCCLVSLGLLWQYGDQIMRALGQY